MKEVHHYGYFPLTEHTIKSWVPQMPGLYMLAVTENGKKFNDFHVSYSDDLAQSLMWHLRSANETPAHHADGRNATCYFAFVMLGHDEETANTVGKLFSQTSDPVKSVAVVACN